MLLSYAPLLNMTVQYETHIYEKYINILEEIQRRAAHFVKDDYNYKSSFKIWLKNYAGPSLRIGGRTSIYYSCSKSSTIKKLSRPETF